MTRIRRVGERKNARSLLAAIAGGKANSPHQMLEEVSHLPFCRFNSAASHNSDNPGVARLPI